ncbi:MAG: ROK family protein [Ruthenibacterium lactatiformans]
MEKPQYTAAHLKGMNRHVVYDFIRERGATSKARIVKETGISPPTVIKIVSYLVERGLVVEAGEGAAGVGRRPQLLAINGPGRFSAVFALEGSFLSMGLVDISGRVLHRQKTRTAQDFGAFLAEVRDGLVSSLLHAAGADPARLIGVGVTLPGTYDPARRVLDYAPAIGVFGPVEIGPWMDGMTQKFGVPVYVENDTNAQCMGEHELCRARDLVYVSAGTGVGAGVMLDGRLRRGETNKCGEIGYNVFFEDYKRTARAQLPGAAHRLPCAGAAVRPGPFFPPQPDPARASGADGGPGDEAPGALHRQPDACAGLQHRGAGRRGSRAAGRRASGRAERQAGGAVPLAGASAPSGQRGRRSHRHGGPYHAHGSGCAFGGGIGCGIFKVSAVSGAIRQPLARQRHCPDARAFHTGDAARGYQPVAKKGIFRS